MFKLFLKNNRYHVFVTLSFVFICIFSINSNYGVINHFFKYFTNPTLQREDFLIYEFIKDIDQKYNVFQAWKMELSIFVRTVEGLFVWSTELYQILLPIIVSVSCFATFNQKETINHYIYPRKKKYRTFVFEDVLKKSIAMAFSVYIGFVIIWVINHFLYTHMIDPQHPGRSLLSDILGKRFFIENTFLYFLLEGAIRFFFMPFIYSFFANACAYVVNKGWKAYLASNLYYFVLAIVGFVLLVIGSEAGRVAIYITPSVIMSSGDYEFSTYIILLTNSLPLLIGSFILYRHTQNIEL